MRRAGCLVAALAGLWGSQGLRAQTFTLKIDGPCGETLTGENGSYWTDDTGGEDHFFDPEIFQATFEEVPRNRPGHTMDILLVTEGNDTDSGVQGWSYGVGTEGAVAITDITTNGTVSCMGGRFPRSPECLQNGGFELAELTGPPIALPDGRVVVRAGPTEDLDGDGTIDYGGPGNSGAVSAVVLAQQLPIQLPPEGASTVVKIRVMGRFPDEVDDAQVGRLFFEQRQGSGQPVANVVTFRGLTINERSEPPLALESCEIRFLSTDPPRVGEFRRCDPNDDRRTNIADAVWIVNELFRSGPANGCLGASDCNADGMKDLADALFAIFYLFMEGPEPSFPFGECGTDDGATPENCPAGSTRCDA